MNFGLLFSQLCPFCILYREAYSWGHSVLQTHFSFFVNVNCFLFCLGNYYSLRSQHEKAVLYFQRSVKLNPLYLSAWTLMGHEFMEMKNTNAAIQAYRQAIGTYIWVTECNRRLVCLPQNFQKMVGAIFIFLTLKMVQKQLHIFSWMR